ncbi:hypothetical protein QNH20_19225 [Neobacillus sp. WH10]|uniref:hypothetical protein n=1 Tax=Neobacillus sp. WH10 TaxID=3047873 RepID=UPI0024C19176|nr:hypothetical protein [Neobacillus sp. WH10]WHY76238.1 hypothetical protein QNH20_19225 [Neobacillus sp. WH10]
MILSEDYIGMKEYKVVLIVVFEKVKEAFQMLVDAVIELWDEMVEFTKQITDDCLFLDDKPVWNTPKKFVMKSQVLNRRPLLSRARSCC